MGMVMERQVSARSQGGSREMLMVSSRRLHTFMEPRTPGWFWALMIPASSRIFTFSAAVDMGRFSAAAISPTFMHLPPSTRMISSLTGEESAWAICCRGSGRTMESSACLP